MSSRRFPNWGWLAAIVLCFIAPAACTSATLPPTLYRDDIIEVKAILVTLSTSEIGLPRDIVHARDIYVFVTATGGHTKITVLSIAMTSDKLADLLASATSDAGLRGGIPARRDVLAYSAASLVISRARYGAAEAVNHVPIATIARAFRDRGLTPYVLLRIPRYARTGSVHLPREPHAKSIWYNATNAHSGLTVTVYSNMPAGASSLVLYLGYLLPALGLCGLVAGFGVGLSRRLSARRRVAGFDWLAMALPALAGMACAMSDLALENSALARPIGDIWLRDPSGDLLLPRTLICAGVMFAVLPLVGFALRGCVLRGLDEEPDLPDIGHMLCRGRRIGIAGLVYAVGFVLYVVATRSFEFQIPDAIRHLPMMLPCFISPLVMRFAMMDLFKPSIVDVELTDRAKRLSSAFGAVVREVRVAKGRYARKNPNGVALPRKRRIIVTRRAVETLSPREMDWLLAHELAHFSDHRVYKGLLPAHVTGFAAVLVVFGSLGLGSFGASPVPILLVGLVPVLAFLSTSEVLEMRRRLEHEADIQAMVTIHDLGAAISGLVAMRDHSQHPKLQDTELDVHPKLKKRITAVRMAAERLGIPDGGEEGAAPTAASGGPAATQQEL